ncbi:MAG: hypothetical protein L6R40_000783 [Gallowayella cf. fulva]|nr:MAG: hypothetical protein L6R40_000783 [Xanthomendoza cf. fulva]
MTEISVPRTPSPAHAMRQDKFSAEAEDTNVMDSQVRSTPVPAPIDLTPPPSTQIPKHARSTLIHDKRESSLASPPLTSKPGPPFSQGRLFGEVPTMDAVEKMPEEQVRTLVAELLPALSEARMSAAHSKLQHNLLCIETNEAANKAEVEREMTRREVQVLQESPRLLSPRSPHHSAQRHLDLALKRCRELQTTNEQLAHRMHAARKLIRDLSGKNEILMEDNHLLRQRIRQNRDHLNAMRSSGAISVNGTPLTDFGTPALHRTPKTPATARSAHTINHTPGGRATFEALLLADEVLKSHEANSVPSTPTRTKGKKVSQAHHIRGAHSLSSLPSTPNRSRPMTADGSFLTPTPHRATNAHANLSVPSKPLNYAVSSPQREDRDSTISASEDEGEGYSQHVTASQASQRATEMLRRSALNTKDNSPRSSQNHKASASSRNEPSQAQMHGNIKKHYGDASGRVDKRVGSGSFYEDTGRGSKKAKMGNGAKESVGLGIERWERASK